MRPLLLLLVFLLPLQSCLTDLGRCTYEIRSTSFAGDLRGTVQGKPDSATSALSYGAQRPGYRSLQVTIATNLAGAISTVEIMNGAQPGEPVIAVFTGGSTEPGHWSGYLELDERSLSPDGYVLLAETGNLKIVATILTGSGGVLGGTLKLVDDTGWERPYCD